MNISKLFRKKTQGSKVLESREIWIAFIAPPGESTNCVVCGKGIYKGFELQKIVSSSVLTFQSEDELHSFFKEKCRKENRSFWSFSTWEKSTPESVLHVLNADVILIIDRIPPS